jgi:hypothetical protein
VSGRTFDLGDVLSITTGRLVSQRGMDGIYDVLNFMTGDDLMTHQLPRAMDECAPRLLEQHPDLAEVVVPDKFDGEHHVRCWVTKQKERFGESRSLRPLPAGDHPRIHPLTELAMMAPGKPVIVVETPPDDGAS